MNNAHERFGVLEYTKRMKDTTTRIRLRLDRFIGEIETQGNGKAHLISVLGGESYVGAIWNAVIEQNLFTVEAPEFDPLTASLGEDAQCFRGRITIAGRKPIRHLVAICLSWPRPGREQIRKAGEPSCVTTTRRLSCTASPNGSDCLWCRSGPAGSKKNSTAVER